MSNNAMWRADFTVKGPLKTHPNPRGVTIYQDGAGFRGSCYFSSPDLANPGKARRRARDTLTARLVRAGIPKRAIAVFNVQCVG